MNLPKATETRYQGYLEELERRYRAQVDNDLRRLVTAAQAWRAMHVAWDRAAPGSDKTKTAVFFTQVPTGVIELGPGDYRDATGDVTREDRLIEDKTRSK